MTNILLFGLLSPVLLFWMSRDVLGTEVRGLCIMSYLNHGSISWVTLLISPLCFQRNKICIKSRRGYGGWSGKVLCPLSILSMTRPDPQFYSLFLMSVCLLLFCFYRSEGDDQHLKIKCIRYLLSLNIYGDYLFVCTLIYVFSFTPFIFLSLFVPPFYLQFQLPLKLKD